MDKTKISIIAGLLVLLSLNMLVKPYLEQRDVTRVVQATLDAWQKGDAVSVYALWKDPRKSPPVYGLISYAIMDKSFLKKDSVRHAQVVVRLEFTADNISPSGKKWIFELEKNSSGWQIVDFQLVNH